MCRSNPSAIKVTPMSSKKLVEQEHDVEQENLDKDAHERWLDTGRGMSLLAFKFHMDLVRTLAEQKYAPDEEDEVTARDLLPEHGKERRSEADDPGQREEQRDPQQHGQPQSQGACPRLLCRREFPHEDRDEDDIVDSEHEFERGERQERDPRLRVCQPFHRVTNSCLYGERSQNNIRQTAHSGSL